MHFVFTSEATLELFGKGKWGRIAAMAEKKLTRYPSAIADGPNALEMCNKDRQTT